MRAMSWAPVAVVLGLLSGDLLARSDDETPRVAARSPNETLIPIDPEDRLQSDATVPDPDSVIPFEQSPAAALFDEFGLPHNAGQEGLLSDVFDVPDHEFKGFVDLNYYWDDRDFNVLTVNTGAKLPYDFEYFSLLNVFGSFGDASELENWTGFFTEHNLRRPIAKDSECLKSMDWNIQWADGNGPNEVLRLGIRNRFHDMPGPIGDLFRDVLKTKYVITFTFYEGDGSGWQMEHVYRREFLDGLIYVGGFADHNINGTSDSSDWVAECQFGLRLHGNLYAVAEQRYFSFVDDSRFKSGWGYGVEYVLRFR